MEPNGLGSMFLGDLSKAILNDLLRKHIICFKIYNPIFYNYLCKNLIFQQPLLKASYEISNWISYLQSIMILSSRA